MMVLPGDLTVDKATVKQLRTLQHLKKDKRENRKESTQPRSKTPYPVTTFSKDFKTYCK